MSSLLFTNFQKKIREGLLFSKNETIILAVSGGVDSVVLTDLLTRIQEKWNLKIIVAHVNYHLREEESNLDAHFVEKLAKDRNLVFEIYSVEPKEWKSDQNIQEQARNIRYSFFKNLAQKYNSSKIITAHHANDQVETFFLRLIRGTRLSGAKGIESKRLLIASPFPIFLIRPLLDFLKKELIEYAKSRNLHWREDRTNKTTEYTRNFIRHNVLHPLSEVHPSSLTNFLELMEQFSQQNSYIDSLLEKEMQEKLDISPNEITLPLDWIQKQSFSFLRYRIYEKTIQKISELPVGVQKQHLRAIDQAAMKKKKQSKITLPHSLRITVENDKLVFQKNLSKSQQKRGFFY